jgi:uncharacterized protein YijF (DUF1287 family)
MKRTSTIRFGLLLLVLFFSIWFALHGTSSGGEFTSGCGCSQEFSGNELPAQTDSFLLSLSDAAIERTDHDITYDPAYVVIDYPGGDIAPDRGVCTDVVVRSYRKVGIDLQKEIHEDMKRAFPQYPQIWGLPGPDKNIDHRRVPNIMTFLKRKGTQLPITKNAADYLPGDIVAWDLGGGTTHIGIVVADTTISRARYKIVHNIGDGPQMEDVLFEWEIIGHYRYTGN